MNHMGWVCCYKSDCCFIKILLISLPDLCARDFCIPPVKIFQMKLSMAMRWALNKNQYRTVPSRKIITCTCWHISEKFFSIQLKTQCFADVQIPHPYNTSQQREEDMLLYFPVFETARKAEDWELTYTINTFLFCRNFFWIITSLIDRYLLPLTFSKTGKYLLVALSLIDSRFFSFASGGEKGNIKIICIRSDIPSTYMSILLVRGRQ